MLRAETSMNSKYKRHNMEAEEMYHRLDAKKIEENETTETQ